MTSKVLFHYTNCEAAKKIIESSKLKLSFSPKVNDPFDLGKDIIYDPEDTDGIELYAAMCSDPELSRICPGFAGVRFRSSQYVLSVVNKAIGGWDFPNVVRNTPFISFSKKMDIRLMWAHYGDGYRGVVLEFQGHGFNRAEEVIYNSFEKLPSVLTKERLIKLLKNNTEESNSFGKDLLVKKHSEWGYEEEARLILDPRGKYFEENGSKFYQFNTSALTGVYFGLKCDDKDINEIMNIKKLRFFQMKRRAGYIDMFSEEVKQVVFEPSV